MQKITSELPMSVKFQNSFYEDWSAHLGNELTKIGYVIPSYWDDRKVAMAYFNVQKRRIDPAARSFVFATDFICPPDCQPGLDWLREKSERGDDINPHCSKDLRKAGKFDPLLFDWGIHHFHLGKTLESNGFVARTELILLAMVKNDSIYCIATRPHGKTNPGVWVERDLLEIVHSNWPDLITHRRLNVESVGPKITDEEYLDFRKNGLSTPVELQDGTVYLSPGGGYTSGRNSIDVILEYNQSVNGLEILKRKIELELPQITKKIRMQSKYYGNAFLFALERSRNTWIVREKKSGVAIYI
jgi:hypothetical protein